MTGAVTADQIDWALNRVAIAIVKAGPDGPGYLPIFERLEAELASALEQEAMMQRALGRAGRCGFV